MVFIDVPQLVAGVNFPPPLKKQYYIELDLDITNLDNGFLGRYYVCHAVTINCFLVSLREYIRRISSQHETTKYSSLTRDQSFSSTRSPHDCQLKDLRRL
ncbi:uncharacterized protein EAE97_006998 [Botrytis byssoidea]|uniref:Uncharacterized protein n=1 Tax=Botrytis byssoidea TaxID=139641 RepID=A0A9P5IHC3_9HELO|nr:uncharacterized protein EAE97_006998 [Botrytis byssoidea]KAF7940812.1 hypothetical protein EAE97_006998 [Botrytis byssoidea]